VTTVRAFTAHDLYRKRGYADIRESETAFGLNYTFRKSLRPGAGAGPGTGAC
jgi:hypothetical protein